MSPEEGTKFHPMDRGAAPGEPVIVGRVVDPRGMKGEVQIEVISDSPGRFSPGGVLFLQGRPHTIQRSSPQANGRLYLKLEGIESRTEAEGLRHTFLTVSEDMVGPLPEGEYYHFQIIDTRVFTSEGEYLGRVTEIISTGSNDVYVAAHDGTELLVPALEEVILKVDLQQGTMTVELPPGLR